AYKASPGQAGLTVRGRASSSRPAEEQTATTQPHQSAVLSEYRVRLHIHVQNPETTQPATDEPTASAPVGDPQGSTATFPADVLRFDPSVLDLGGRRSVPASSQPTNPQTPDVER